MSLAALQRDFIDWLRTGDDAHADRLGGGAGPPVYLNNHRGGLMAGLSASYEQSRRWLGDEAFEAAAGLHIDAHDPTSWTLDAYGVDFPETLAETFPDDPELADLARLEWRLGQAFIAADGAALRMEDLGGIDWEAARLRLTPGATLLEVRTNAEAILRALLADEPPPAARSLDTASLILVWRYDFVPCFRRLEDEEAPLFARLEAGVAFADLCADLVAARGEEAGVAAAGGCLARWTAEGYLTTVDA